MRYVAFLASVVVDSPVRLSYHMFFIDSLSRLKIVEFC